MTRPLLLGAALALSALALRGTAQAPATATLRLDVVVVDERGRPVTDVRPGELELWISGYRVPVLDVLAVTPDSHPRTIVVLLDNAAVGPTLAPRVREAARHFVDALEPGDRLAVVPFEGGGVELTGDRARLRQALDAYSVRGMLFRPEDGGRHVLRTMADLSQQLAETSDVRKVIAAIGAGWMFDTPLPPPGVQDLQQEWVAAMRSMAATLTSLYVIDPVGLDVRRPGGYAGTTGFARETGGHAFLNTNDLAGAAQRIRAEAGTYYVLRFANPPVQRAADLREVEVRIQRQGVTVRARRGISGRS